MSELTDRFIKYARINTASDSSSSASPTTAIQMDFLRTLKDELKELGMEDIKLDEKGTLFASLPGSCAGDTIIGLLAHVDTSPEAPGENVRPVIHPDWDGTPIELCDGVVIDPDDTCDMKRYIGDAIITSDGTTLLGADDKAGVAIIMEILDTLINNSEIPRPPLRIAFTTDEEVGKGMDNFDAAEFGVDFAYTVDGGCVGKVDIQTFNAWSADWRVKGREVHPGSAKGIMVNATRIIADIISSINSEEMPENSSGDEGYYYPLSVSSNTSEGSLKMILRDFTFDGMQSRIETMKSLEKWIQVKYPGAEIELLLSEQYRNPGEILERDRRAVEFAMTGTREAGLEPEESSIRGGTDGSRLSFMGTPTVNLPTGGELFHSRKEWISERGMELSYRIVLETLKVWGTQ